MINCMLDKGEGEQNEIIIKKINKQKLISKKALRIFYLFSSLLNKSMVIYANAKHIQQEEE